MTSAGRPSILQRAVLWSLLALSLGLNLYGIDWGMPNVNAWHPDDIANETLRALADRFSGFTKYPFVHYLTLAAAWSPYLGWLSARGDIATDAQTLEDGFADPVASMTTLIIVGRVVSALMGMLTVLLTYRIGFRLTGRRWPALAGAAAFAFVSEIVFFAHLTNVDVPMMFWFALAFLFYLRVAESFRVRDGLLLGFFVAVAVSTKEQIAGATILMAASLFVLFFLERRRRREDPEQPAPSFYSLLAAGVAVTITFLVLNKVIFDFSGYRARLEQWFSVGIRPSDQQFSFSATATGQVRLLLETIHRTGLAMGWPLVVAGGLGIFVGLLRWTRASWLVAIPLLSYHIFTIAMIRYIYTRFTFPIIFFLALGVVVGLAQLPRRGRLTQLVSAIVIAILASGLYRCIRLDGYFERDPRYRSEQWLQENLAADARPVEVYAYEHYLPRFVVQEIDFVRISHAEMNREAFSRRQPEVVVLAPACWYHYRDVEPGYTDWVRQHPDYEEIVFEAQIDSEWLPPETRRRLQPTSIILHRRQRRDTDVQAQLSRQLAEALALYAPFDEAPKATFARGDREIYTAKSDRVQVGMHRGDAGIEDEGRFGRALHLAREGRARLFYRGESNLSFQAFDWSGTVSFWMKPQLGEGSSSPQDILLLAERTWDDAALWIDFDLTGEEPVLRMGAFPDRSKWNPEGLDWADVPESVRRLVQVPLPPRNPDWIHVAITFENLNSPRAGQVRLFLDGERQGGVTRDDFTLSWDPGSSRILIGDDYTGWLDDLAIFDRALSPQEIVYLHRLENGVRSLR